jgi:uncharacterized protein YegL
MGWASYREDIISRYLGDRRASVAPHKPEPLKQGPKMTQLKEFSISPARPLPVILLADISGSMKDDGKIEALNAAVAEMFSTFAEEDEGPSEIQISVITFGGSVSTHIPPTAAKSAKWIPLQASGGTPMGEAFRQVAALIENKEKLPSRAYRPVLILASDGIPTDEWRGPLKTLLDSERAKKAQRFALGIGADADKNVLREFLADPEAKVFEAHEARQIRKFFRWATMSVLVRSRSIQPNQMVNIPPLDIDDHGDF